MTLHTAGVRSMSRYGAALFAAATGVRSTARRVWRVMRRVAGDDAYECYLAHHAACHADAPPLDRRAYYLNRQRQKWDGVQRCC